MAKKKDKKDDKKKMGRPPTKPVVKRPAYYVTVKVSNSMNYQKTNVLISKDTIPEIKQLIARSPQTVDFLGYWNGKSYEKIPEIEAFIKSRK
jgi:hypothetical protein|tara:strand:- start:9055 stop:9330 length:276 start_codon:yes stop_codon:yes gene_type:complete